MQLLRLLAAASWVLVAAGCAQASAIVADVSIVDRATRQALAAHWHEGRAYVVGRPGTEYEIVVANRTGEEVLAVVSVDGVNAVSGESAGLKQGGYVLGPWRTTTIRGWRKSLEETASFFFTSLGNSYAGRTGRPGNAGVIGVALFQRAAPPRESITMDTDARHERSLEAQKRSLAQAPAAAAPLGTGHGRRGSSPVHAVSFARAAQPAQVTAIYYDSYRNLVAQGVIATPLASRDPSPFPAGFVPDPPR